METFPLCLTSKRSGCACLLFVLMIAIRLSNSWIELVEAPRRSTSGRKNFLTFHKVAGFEAFSIACLFPFSLFRTPTPQGSCPATTKRTENEECRPIDIVEATTSWTNENSRQLIQFYEPRRSINIFMWAKAQSVKLTIMLARAYFFLLFCHGSQINRLWLSIAQWTAKKRLFSRGVFLTQHSRREHC